ncbi:3-hydroxyacyl-CoA dehydrogenase family protein [Papillibacter cinnamivorans]|uniref:L-gulonate 3-dehydrogenase n=1 Tax=Papillibacter cinnamivorans DSM 12816 TaxID=1122930 RepID=A0A1W1YD90_9FIRM|nr:3-hydroxyacyl-CoA dehydrogenase family protein [Papillibacter cinnamivorans]SMC34190.1 3-hydroxyacyl-CoA dehydrogenase, C-terminal domain [Papillibacter cinnamivorans DSM 12816]
MEIKKVACIGSGVIGSSWATGFALKGYPVMLYDIDEKFLKTAKERIAANLKYLAKNKVITEEQIKEIMGRVSYTTDMETAVRDVQFIQESVLENYDTKHKVIAEVEKYAPADAIYASSTSGLLITEIAKYAKHPERFIGGHPYNPPHLIPLVEITKGEKTTDAVVEAGKAFYKSVGKEPVVLNKEALGFISNRIQQAVFREVTELVTRGVCSLEDAGKAVTFGPALRWAIMGPAEIFQLGGGEKGIDGLFKMVEGSVNMWLDDMADWKRYPAGWWDYCRKEVDKSIAARPKEIGNTDASLAEYRDDMLIALLKLHNKL